MDPHSFPVQPIDATSDAKPDIRPENITEFAPSSLESVATPIEEENDYIPELFEVPDRESPSFEAVGGVAWAATDRLSPCYSHLLVDGGDDLKVEKNFEFGKAEFELLAAANRFMPRGSNDTIAFGLRGARLRGADKFEQVDRIPLEDARPNHKAFRCVMGFYFRATGKFSAYTASTVPWHAYMTGGVKNNLLPPGCYIYKKGNHTPETESRWVIPALRLSDANGAHSGAVTVLRNKRNDVVFDLSDAWDECNPSDNIHCAYKDTSFSSLGCQTVKGGMHDGQWAKFQSTIKTFPSNARVDYVMLTGTECSIAHAMLRDPKQPPGDSDILRRLGRLRSGAEGDEVVRLQTALGVTPTGYFGASTKKKLTQVQVQHGIPADGVYAPAVEAKLGWSIFSDAAPVIVAAVATAPVNLESTASNAAAATAPPQMNVAPGAPAPASPPVTASKPAVLLTVGTLQRFAPEAKPDYVAILGSQGNEALASFDINANVRRFCHFMAQVGHECGGFTITHEKLNYTAKRMVEVFGPGKHSAKLTLAEAKTLVGREEAFAERIYGLGNPVKAKDLGNTQPGDGYRYRGRGFLQITGRSAYRDMGRRIKVDIEANPDLVAEPFYALMTAAAFWDSRRLNPDADANNIERITKKINGGHNGLTDRRLRYAEAVGIWGGGRFESLAEPELEQANAPRTLEYGDLGPDVEHMKKLLTASGYDGFHVDEDFSRATHMAVVRFKMDHGMPGDGVVDDETWSLLQHEAGARSSKPAPPKSQGPQRGFDVEAAKIHSRGHAVFEWGLLLLVVAVGLYALRFVETAGIVLPPLAQTWLELGLAGLVAISALALMLIGRGITKSSGSTRAPALDAAEPQRDEGIRSEVNLAESG